MEYLKVLLFSLVEGISEWLPISSTAHMKILNHFISLNVSQEFYSVFEVVIQLGAALALFLVFFKKIWPFGYSKKPLGEGILKFVKKEKFILWVKIVVACLPVIIYELFLEDLVHIVNENNEMLIIGLSLIIIGGLFIVVEEIYKYHLPKVINKREITYNMALIVGLSQLVAAIFPGVSRSGATIITGLLLGISRSCIVEFSFELSIPVMFGASLMKILKYGLVFSFSEIIMLLLGVLSTFIISLFMINFLLSFIKKHSFVMFGIYRILLGIIVILFLI